MRNWEKKQRDSLSDWWVKKCILIRGKGKIKTNQITGEMIEQQRGKLLEWKHKKKNHLLKKDSIVKGPYKCKCIVCGIDFLGKISKSNKCSKECEYEAFKIYKRKEYRGDWKQPEPFECKECGKMVVIEYGMKRDKYCSEKCMNKSEKSNLAARRRLRMIDGFVERISKTKIFERDNGRCGICGRKVNKNLKHPHPMSPTLDHIIPLAKGGRHERKNVRLAHMICNSKKREIVSDNGDQLRLFG